MKGGNALMPPQLADIGRGLQFGLGSAYNAINGYAAPVNPNPYEGQLNGGVLPDDVLLRV